MTTQQWLDKATTFDLGLCQIHGRKVYIEARDQMDKTRLWVVKMEKTNGWVLGKDKEWYYEPLPSSRSNEFIELTRFSSPDEAYEFWLKNVTEKKILYIN